MHFVHTLETSIQIGYKISNKYNEFTKPLCYHKKVELTFQEYQNIFVQNICRFC